MDTAIPALAAAGGNRTSETIPYSGQSNAGKAVETSARQDQEVKEAQSTAAAREMTKKIQKELDFSNVRIAFTPYGAEGERVAIKVMDRETGEVIREIPPEEIQSLYSKMGEMAGMLFHKKA